MGKRDREMGDGETPRLADRRQEAAAVVMKADMNDQLSFSCFRIQPVLASAGLEVESRLLAESRTFTALRV